MLSHFSYVQFFATPWTVACQAFLSMELSRQEYWSVLPCPPLGNLPDPGIEPVSLTSPALAGAFFTISTICGVTGKFGLGVQNKAEQRLRVLSREHTGHSKHPFPTTQENTLHMDITRWSIPKSDWLNSLQPKMEKLYSQFHQENTQVIANTFSNNTRDNSTYGNHQMVNTKIRLIIFFAAKDGEAVYSQQNKTWSWLCSNH